MRLVESRRSTARMESRGVNDDPSWVKKMGKSWKGQIFTDTGFAYRWERLIYNTIS